MIAYGWLAWLLLFLCYEIPAAIAEVVYARRGQRRAITLSRNVWRWVGLAEGQQWRPYRRLRQAALFVFLQVLAFHLAFATPGGAWVIAAAIPVALVIGYAVLVEDRRTARLLAEIDRLMRENNERARARAKHAEPPRADTRGGR